MADKEAEDKGGVVGLDEGLTDTEYEDLLAKKAANERGVDKTVTRHVTTPNETITRPITGSDMAENNTNHTDNSLIITSSNSDVIEKRIIKTVAIYLCFYALVSLGYNHI